jgi:hypothetical protein
MHILCVVPTNANPRSRKPKTKEQKEVRQARDRLNYAKKNIQSKKGPEKTSSMVLQSCSERYQQ